MFVAVAVTVVLPTGKERGEVITVVPILYTTVGAGGPVTVTFCPKETVAAQVFVAAVPLRLVAVTTGTLFGVATAELCPLAQPALLLLTVYVPAAVTVIEVVVAPVLHRIDPPGATESVELPQLLTTVTMGCVPSSEATPDPGALVHPFTVRVTV